MEKFHKKNKTRQVGLMKKHFPTIFKILSTTLILYLLFANINFSGEEFTHTLEQININWLLLSLPVVIVVLGIKSLRWQAIISAEGYAYSHFKSFSAYLASYSLGVVTPGRLGELLKVYNLRKDQPGIDVIMAFRTVVLDRLFDMFFLVWFGLAGVIFYFKPLGYFKAAPALLISFMLAFAGLLVGNLILKFIREKYFKSNATLQFLQSCTAKMLSFKNLKAWLATAIAYAIYFAGIKMLFLALNIPINFLETGFIISLIGLILLLPISVAGFGTREAGLVFLLSFYTINPEIAISFSLLQFLTFFVWGGIVGLIFWMVSPVPLGIIREDSKKIWEKIKGKR